MKLSLRLAAASSSSSKYQRMMYSSLVISVCLISTTESRIFSLSAGDSGELCVPDVHTLKKSRSAASPKELA
ncbi:hypothetical protein D3C75_1285260 [compost metagenome]